MSSTPFGDHLKREREMRGVTLEEISAATRIGSRFLTALENEDWDRLPGGVFNRGFIRSVARFLGLDEDSLITEYEMETKEMREAGAAGHPPPRITRNWQPAAVALALLGVAVAGSWLAYHHYRLEIRRYLHKMRSGSASMVTSAPGSSAPNVPPTAASSDAADGLTLKIVAGKSADVKVIADGATVFDGRMDPDGVKFFNARNDFEIGSSDGSAVRLELNGRPVPPLGAPGQPGSVTLTRKDLNPAPGESH